MYFCSTCGATRTEGGLALTETHWTCLTCSAQHWANPKPVAVLLQPVYAADGQRGLLLGRRVGVDQAGLWGLPGGFMELSDRDVSGGAVRELYEETGLTVPVAHMRIVWDVCDGRHIVMFVANGYVMAREEIDRFRPSDECDAVRVATKPENLAFGSHSHAMMLWFSQEW